MRWIRPFKFVFGAAEGLLDRVLCVVGAILFSQAPEFMQQYLQRLGGHLDEAMRQLEQLQAAAARSGLTLGQLAERAAATGDPAVARLGRVATETAARVDALAAAEAAIRHASILGRPFVFLRHLDPSIARATVAVFRPAVPTTPEGFAYAVAGMVALLGAYHFGVRRPLQRAWGARRPAAPVASPGPGR